MVTLSSRRKARGPGQPDLVRQGVDGSMCLVVARGQVDQKCAVEGGQGKPANEQMTWGRKRPGPQIVRQQIRRWLHLPFPTPWHRAGLALCLACLHKPEDRPAPVLNGHQDTHQFIQWFWGRVLALAFSFLGPGSRLSVVSCFLILRKCRVHRARPTAIHVLTTVAAVGPQGPPVPKNVHGPEEGSGEACVTAAGQGPSSCRSLPVPAWAH